MKKIKIISIAALSIFILTGIVKAEEQAKVCKNYTNYYFFNEINDIETVENLVKGASSETGAYRYHVTYYPELEGEKQSEGRVCLQKDNVVDGKNCKETWTLNKYYETYVNMIKNGQVVSNFVNGLGNTTSYTKLYDSDKRTSYFMHGYWFEKENGVIDNHGKGVVDITNLPTSTLVAGSFLPTSTTLIFDYTGNASSTAIFAEVDRTLKVLDYRKLKEGKTEADIDLNNLDTSTSLNITPFSLDWGDGTIHAKSVLTPALYKVVYEKCEDAYNADIEYFVKESDGTLTPAKEYDKEIVNYSKSELDDGYTEPVNTPKLSGCTADKAKVEVKIEGKDFYDKVIYTCKANQEINNNSKTGDALIYIAWVIGLGAIGYSVYYFRKLKKEEV